MCEMQHRKMSLLSHAQYSKKALKEDIKRTKDNSFDSYTFEEHTTSLLIIFLSN